MKTSDIKLKIIYKNYLGDINILITEDYNSTNGNQFIRDIYTAEIWINNGKVMKNHHINQIFLPLNSMVSSSEMKKMFGYNLRREKLKEIKKSME